MARIPFGLCLFMASGLCAAALSGGPSKRSSTDSVKAKAAKHVAAPAKGHAANLKKKPVAKKPAAPPSRVPSTGSVAQSAKKKTAGTSASQSNDGNQTFQNNGVIQNNVGTPGTSQLGDPNKPDKPSLKVTLANGSFTIKAVSEPASTVLNVIAARANVSMFIGETLPATPVTFEEDGLTLDKLPKVLSAYLGVNIVLPCATNNGYWFVSLASGALADGGIRVVQSGEVKTIQANTVSKDQFASAVNFIEAARTNGKWHEADFDKLQDYLAKNATLAFSAPTSLFDLDYALSKYDPTKPLGDADSLFRWISSPTAPSPVTGVWNLSFVTEYVPDPSQAGAGQTPPATAGALDPGVQAVMTFLNGIEGIPPAASSGGGSSPTPAPSVAAAPTTATPATSSSTTGAAGAPIGGTSQTLSVTVSSTSSPTSTAASSTPPAPKPKVTVSALGRNLMMVGDSAEIERLRRLLATSIDVPAAQVRMDMYTFQGVSDVTATRKAPLMHKSVQTLREGILMSKALQELFVQAIHEYVHSLSIDDTVSDGMGRASSLFNLDVPTLLTRGGFNTNPNRKLSQAEIFAFMLFDPGRRNYDGFHPAAPLDHGTLDHDENEIYTNIDAQLKKEPAILQGKVDAAWYANHEAAAAKLLAAVRKDRNAVVLDENWYANLPPSIPMGLTVDNQKVSDVSSHLATLLKDLNALNALDQAPSVGGTSQKADAAAIKAVTQAQNAIQAITEIVECGVARTKPNPDSIYADFQAKIYPYIQDTGGNASESTDIAASDDLKKEFGSYFNALFDTAQVKASQTLQARFLSARAKFEGAFSSVSDPELRNLFDHYENVLHGDVRVRHRSGTWYVTVAGQDYDLAKTHSVRLPIDLRTMFFKIESTGPNGYGNDKYRVKEGAVRLVNGKPVLAFKMTENEFASPVPLYNGDILTPLDANRVEVVPVFFPSLCAVYDATSDVIPDGTDQRAMIEFAKYWTISTYFDKMPALISSTSSSPSLTWNTWKGDDVAGRLSNASSALDKGLKAAADGLHTDIHELCMNPLVSWEESGLAQSTDGVAFHGANSIVVSSSAPALQSTTAQAFFQYQQPVTAQDIATQFASLSGNGLNIGDLAGLGSGATALRAVANLLGAAIEAGHPPVYNRIAPGVSMAIQPSVLRDSESARLQILLKVSDAPDASTNQVTNHQDLTSSSNLTTDVNVNELDLFQLTSADFRITGPTSRPTWFGMGVRHNVKSEDLDTVICVQVTILPRSLDIAGKTLTLDLESVSAGGK